MNNHNVILQINFSLDGKSTSNYRFSNQLFLSITKIPSKFNFTVFASLHFKSEIIPLQENWFLCTIRHTKLFLFELTFFSSVRFCDGEIRNNFFWVDATSIYWNWKLEWLGGKRKCKVLNVFYRLIDKSSVINLLQCNFDC